MRKRLGVLALVAVASLLLLVQLRTQPAEAKNRNTTTAAKTVTKEVRSVGATADEADINQDALAALNGMGTYLRSLKAFQVLSVITRDDVLDDGELIQYDTNVNLLARMPDRLRVEVTSSRQHRLYFYNGKEFTLFAQRVNYYAMVPAPPTVGKLADVLDD